MEARTPGIRGAGPAQTPSTIRLRAAARRVRPSGTRFRHPDSVVAAMDVLAPGVRALTRRVTAPFPPSVEGTEMTLLFSPDVWSVQCAAQKL